MELLVKDLLIETFRRKGYGLKCDDSVVRITHKPTGEIVLVDKNWTLGENKRDAIKEIERRIKPIKAKV